MSDVYEKNLEQKQQPALGDFLRLIGNEDDASYRVLISDIAKAIIEQYQGSTIGGSAQSVKTLVDNMTDTIGDTTMGTTATTLTGAVAEHEGDISGINNTIGDTTMGTTATTLTGAVAEHENDIGTIVSAIGNTSMGTTADTLTGAIAEHEGDLADLNSNLDKKVKLVTNNPDLDKIADVKGIYTRDGHTISFNWSTNGIYIDGTKIGSIN